MTVLQLLSAIVTSFSASGEYVVETGSGRLMDQICIVVAIKVTDEVYDRERTIEGKS